MKNFSIKKICFILFLLPSLVHAGSLAGFVKKDSKVFQFSNFITTDMENQFYLQYKSQGEEVIKVIYQAPNNKKKEFSNIKLNNNELFSFPEEGKFIVFHDTGLHKIIIESSSGVSKLINIQITDSNLYKNIFSNLEDNFTIKKTDKIKIPNQFNFGASLKTHRYNKTLTRSSSKVYDFVSDSVVFINGYQKDRKGDEVEGFGAGVAISEKHILTNVHVLKGLNDLALTTKPKNISDEDVYNGEWYRFKVLAEDPKLDLALLEVVDPNFTISPLSLGEQSNITVGQEVHAIGHPTRLFWTYTSGIVSQIRKKHKWAYSNDWNLEADVIQTQTPINPGNSGGPLIDNDHNLIGIVSMVVPNNENLNFAVSVSSVKAFLKNVKVKYKNSNFKQQIINEINVAVEDCTIINRSDIDKDGIIERVDLDCNKDGKRDTVHFDRDENGKIDAEYYDRDQNKWVEESKEWKKVGKEEWIIYKIYSNNGKNKVTKIGYDYNQDGNIDKIQTFS